MLQCVLSFLLRTARRSAWVTAHVLALWACWIGLSVPAFADCVNGARDPTEQEKQTAVRVLMVLREAFPVPPGWKVTNDTKIEAPRVFCKGDEVLRLWFQRAFTREQGMKERTAEYNRRPPRGRQTDRERSSTRTRSPRRHENFARTPKIVVKVAMNWAFEPVKDGERFEVPGVPIAYHSASRQEMPGTFTEGMTTLFFGQSRARPVGNPGSLEPLLDPTDPTKPRTFAVFIQADQDRAAQVIQGMNIESLNALTQ